MVAFFIADFAFVGFRNAIVEGNHGAPQTNGSMTGRFEFDSRGRHCNPIQPHQSCRPLNHIPRDEGCGSNSFGCNDHADASQPMRDHSESMRHDFGADDGTSEPMCHNLGASEPMCHDAGINSLREADESFPMRNMQGICLGTVQESEQSIRAVHEHLVFESAWKVK